MGRPRDRDRPNANSGSDAVQLLPDRLLQHSTGNDQRMAAGQFPVVRRLDYGPVGLSPGSGCGSIPLPVLPPVARLLAGVPPTAPPDGPP